MRANVTPAKDRARILVVEDEMIVARDIAQQLRMLGYDPAGPIPSGEEAVQRVLEFCPDLVLMDIELAGDMDGIEAAQVIHAQHGVPVVFLSAYSNDEVLARARTSLPFGYLLKPFSERDLRSALEMALYRAAVEQRLLDEAQRFQAIMDCLQDALVTIGEDGRIESANRATTRIFGYETAELVGNNVSMLMGDEHALHHDAYIARYLRGGSPQIIGRPRDLRAKRKDGSMFPINLSVSSMAVDGRTKFIGLVRDTSQHEQDMAEIHRLAYYDRLTQLPNRELLADRIQQGILTTSRSGLRCALMQIDLDHFKQINDMLGHSLGDELLRQVAQRLRSCLREGDSVARLGGDEFGVLLESLPPDEIQASIQVEAVAEKTLSAFDSHFELDGKLYRVTPSIGIVGFTDHQDTLTELFRKVDIALYQAKEAGRNTYRFFNPAMQEAMQAYASMEQDLRQALSKREFVLYYQPQCDVQGRMVGMEALLRWNCPTRGMVPPGQFIPVAESTRLILPLGQWVLQEACSRIASWAHDAQWAHCRLAVNVSALQFAQPDFVDTVRLALQSTGANPAQLELELTESMLANDMGALVAKMHAIKAMGVAFSLDDFGTGYSSLSYLKKLPLDQLKIDQSFVQDLLVDSNDAVIAQTIIALGHSLGLQVLAEGVETAQQRDMLIKMGCDVFQGYLLGRPAPWLASPTHVVLSP